MKLDALRCLLKFIRNQILTVHKFSWIINLRKRQKVSTLQLQSDRERVEVPCKRKHKRCNQMLMRDRMMLCVGLCCNYTLIYAKREGFKQEFECPSSDMTRNDQRKCENLSNIYLSVPENNTTQYKKHNFFLQMQLTRSPFSKISIKFIRQAKSTKF